MNYPEPPTPPEGRRVCATCGFTAPISEYESKHKRCWLGILTMTVIGLSIAAWVGYVIAVVLSKGFGIG